MYRKKNTLGKNVLKTKHFMWQSHRGDIMDLEYWTSQRCNLIVVTEDKISYKSFEHKDIEEGNWEDYAPVAQPAEA